MEQKKTRRLENARVFLMTVSIFGTEVDHRALISVGVAIVAAALLVYFWNDQSHDVPLWCIVATAVVVLVPVVAFGWRRWTRRRPTLGLGDGGSAAASRLSDGGSAAAFRLSTRRSRNRDEDAESLFNLSESFVTVQSFPKVRRYK